MQRQGVVIKAGGTIARIVAPILMRTLYAVLSLLRFLHKQRKEKNNAYILNLINTRY